MATPHRKSQAPKILTRRKLLKRTLAAGFSFAGLGALYAWRIEPHWVALTDVQMALGRLPTAWQGRTIVQISDLHVGPIVRMSYLQEAIEHVNGLAPDMVMITGDFVTYDSSDRIDQAARLLGDLHQPPLGTYAVLGNHDYGPSFRDRAVADSVVSRLRDVNINVLRNQLKVVDGLQLVGVDELWANESNPDLALEGYDPQRPAIAMVHNPDIVDLPQWSGFAGWILAGHTHGGQVDPPLFDPPILPVKNRGRFAGRYALNPNRTLYINRGLGYLRRVRIGCRPEITRFTLSDAPPKATS